MFKPRQQSEIEVWSFFTGAMGLDLGLELAGLATTLAVDIDGTCCQTITQNRPGMDVWCTDVRTLSASAIGARRGSPKDVFLMAGGPPCQSFSPGGNRAALSDPRGNLIYTYLRLVSQIRPRYFLLENVANLVTAALRHRPIASRPGKKWNLSEYSDRARNHGDDAPAMRPEELSGSAIRCVFSEMSNLGYEVNFAVLDAADYGAPQHRLRFIMLGSREGHAPAMPEPLRGDCSPDHAPWSTLRDAIFDLRQRPGPHSVYTPEVARYFELVPPGGNWRHLPKGLQRQALGEAAFLAGGGKMGYFRRLCWETPAPTVTGRANRKGTALCHPDFVRPLSVRECARVQGFPDEWCFSGSMSDQYLQVGNAVPVHLGMAIGRAILDTRASPPRRTNETLDSMLARAIRQLHRRARNKVAQRTKNNSQPGLFPVEAPGVSI
jgi:DNA (cytosine-5)-methyltransferase 1